MKLICNIIKCFRNSICIVLNEQIKTCIKVSLTNSMKIKIY